MNDTPHSRPRFYCRLVRLRSPDAASGLAARHAAACPGCREFFRAAHALEAALRRDAVRGQAPVPTDLERRIVQAIRASTPAPAPSRAPWLGVAGAAVAALAALAVVFLHESPAPPVAPKTLAPNVLVQEEALSLLLNDAVLVSADIFRQTVTVPAGKLISDNPLQRELDSAYTHTRTALDFLALNFLPSSYVPGAVDLPPEQAGAKG